MICLVWYNKDISEAFLAPCYVLEMMRDIEPKGTHGITIEDPWFIMKRLCE